MAMSEEDAIFNAARQVQSAELRRLYVEQACGGNLELQARIQALLHVYEDNQSFLQVPADGPRPILELPLGRETGTFIGPYKLIERLGEGGMGTVYLAEQTIPVKRQVALKIVKSGMDSRQVLTRFEAERQALALMDHPNIARVLDAGQSPSGATGELSSRPYFVMELVRGIPITNFCDNEHLTPRQRLELFIPVCQAVQHAHQKGIIHRDLKPSNVLVAQYDGRAVPKVIDFGVAKATGPKLTEHTLDTAYGSIIGTLEYMSPEQAVPDQMDIDTRSDVYSLGVLLYELLTGTTPLQKKRLKAGALYEMLRIIREEEPPRPSTRLSTVDELPSIAANRGLEPNKLSGLMRGDLDWIVMKSLERDRGRRYSTAYGLARDIERYLSDEPVEAGPPGAAYRLRKLARKHRVAWATAGATALLVVAGTGVSVWQAVRAKAAEGIATVERDNALSEKARADQQAAIATAVSEFLQNDLLGQAYIGNQPAGVERNKDITVRELLDRAAQRIEGKFQGQEQSEARIRFTIGAAYEELGVFVEAQKQLDRSRALFAQALGEEHTDTLTCMNQLGVLYRRRGRDEEARPLLEKVVEARLRDPKVDLKDLVPSMQNLGALYLKQGRFADAERLCRQVVELLQKQNDKPDRESYLAMNNLALMYLSRGRFVDAEPLLKQVVTGLRSILGHDHPNVLTCTNNLASCYMELRRFNEAEPLYRQVSEIRRMKLGSEHPDTLMGLNLLALSLDAQGRHDEAEALLRDTLRVRRSKLGDDHPDTLTSVSNLGTSLCTRKKYDEAEPLLKRALDGRRANLGDDHPDTIRSINNLGQLYRDTSRLAQAEPLFLEATESGKRKLGLDHPQTRIYISNLIEVYSLQSKAEEAAKWQKLLLPNRPK